jgi:hypothetical protein
MVVLGFMWIVVAILGFNWDGGDVFRVKKKLIVIRLIYLGLKTYPSLGMGILKTISKVIK